MEVKEIQAYANDTVKEMMKHQREQVAVIRNILYAVLISFILMVGMCVGGAMYFLNTFEVEATSETTTTTQTVEGSDATINNVDGNQYKDNSTHNGN